MVLSTEISNNTCPLLPQTQNVWVKPIYPLSPISALRALNEHIPPFLPRPENFRARLKAKRARAAAAAECVRACASATAQFAKAARQRKGPRIRGSAHRQVTIKIFLQSRIELRNIERDVERVQATVQHFMK